MKAKTIKLVLKRKFDDFLASIEDEGLRTLVAENTIITGGCIASMLLREKVNDFDLYFRTKEVAEKVAHYYVDRFDFKESARAPSVEVVVSEDRVKINIKSAGIAAAGGGHEYQYFEGEGADEFGAAEYLDTELRKAEEEAAADDKARYRAVFLSSNAITLSNSVQIITRFFGEPDEIHANYDFIHCTNYWTSWNNSLVLKFEALEALLTKELRYVGSKYPLCSLIRTRKFIRRDWTINAGQYLKMCFQLNQLDLTDMEVLEDQLTGVDAAYFFEIIAILKDAQADGKQINESYLVEVVDRIF